MLQLTGSSVRRSPNVRQVMSPVVEHIGAHWCPNRSKDDTSMTLGMLIPIEKSIVFPFPPVLYNVTVYIRRCMCRYQDTVWKHIHGKMCINIDHVVNATYSTMSLFEC